MLRKIVPPHNRSRTALGGGEEGISEARCNWCRDAHGKCRLLPDGARGPAARSAADKFAAELSEYCRKRGVFPEQVQAWRSGCWQANDWAAERSRQSETEQPRCSGKCPRCKGISSRR